MCCMKINMFVNETKNKELWNGNYCAHSCRIESGDSMEGSSGSESSSESGQIYLLICLFLSFILIYLLNHESVNDYMSVTKDKIY